MNESAVNQSPTEDSPKETSILSEEINPDLTQIEAYAKAKQIIARDLRYLREVLHQRRSERRDLQCRDLMAKLAEDHFTLAVLGQFKRGKSSLMNAVIGRPLLPTGVLPLTSAITVLRYGPQERLLLEREESSVVTEAPLASLPEFVTEKGNPGNRKRIARAIIEIPSPFLRRGLEFVDTPGVGSAIEANTAITMRFLPQCDAVIFITSVDSPLSKTETEFLGRIREHVRKIFFVVNKTDLLGKAERDEVLDFVARNLQSIMGTESVRVFPLSCQRGLEAKTQGDSGSYASSGIKFFEETLSEFLSTEKMSAFLVSILDRIIAVADEEIREMKLEARAREISSEELAKRKSELQKCLETLRSSREARLSAICGSLMERAREIVLEQAVKEARSERALLHDEIDRLASTGWWNLVGLMANRWKQTMLDRLNRRLDDWAERVWETIWPSFQEAVRAEIQAILDDMDRISAAAAQILNLEPEHFDAFAGADSFPVEKDMRPIFTQRLAMAHLRKKPSAHDGDMSDKLESPTFPLGGFLPIGLCRGLLRRHCQNAVDQALRSASLAIGESVLKKCSNTLEGTVHGLKDVASTIEQRVWSIVTGQKVSSPVVVIADPPEKQAERMEELRSRLNNLRTALTDYQAASFGKLVSVPVFIEPERPKLPDQSLPAPDPSKGNLASELQTRSCPACNRVYKVMFDFFAHWQYELSTNEESQAAYAAQGGFCPLHTWQLASIASPQGLSQGYPRLVERIARTLSNLSNKKDDLSRSVAALISDTKHCQACHHLESAERGYLEILRAFLLQSEGQLAYAQSQGLCLRHLSLLLGLDLPADVKNFVLRHSSTILQAMAEDMESFALKRDALRRGLYNQNEMDAHMRAIIHLASARHICLPREEEENG